MMISRVVVTYFSLLLAVSTTYCGSTFLPLHKARPPAHKGTLAIHLARDGARHHHDISDFPFWGSDDTNKGGFYYTKLRLGTPPQEYSVQVDTGSSVLWVNCISCVGCPRTTDLGITLRSFDPNNSSTSSVTPCSHKRCSTCQGANCGYSIAYGDGSVTTGYTLTDQLHLPDKDGMSSYPVKFGCSTERTGQFSDESYVVDGILGLGPEKSSVLSQLFSLGVRPNVFSHCLKGGYIGGGFLVFREVLDPRVVYSPLIPYQNHYQLRLLSISVNKQVVPIDFERVETNGNQGISIDSGTTYSYLLEKDYDSFVNAISHAVSQFAELQVFQDLLCYVQNTSQSIHFPPITLQFDGGRAMKLRPEDYIVYTQFGDGSVKPCMGFRIVSGQVVPTLGEISLKDKVIIYDLLQQRIGWIDQYNCSGPYSVNQSYGFSPSRGYSQFDFLRQQNNVFLLIIILLQLFI